MTRDRFLPALRAALASAVVAARAWAAGRPSPPVRLYEAGEYERLARDVVGCGFRADESRSGRVFKEGGRWLVEWRGSDGGGRPVVYRLAAGSRRDAIDGMDNAIFAAVAIKNEQEGGK